MRSVTEEALRKSILKVVSPYEGSAFIVAPDLALSCIHVCVPDGAQPTDRHKVTLAYWPPQGADPVHVHGEYLPEQSDPDHDLAVIRVDLPTDLRIPAVPLSCDDQARERVMAFGFPDGQPAIRRVPGVIDPIHYADPVSFEPDGWTCPVLHLNTREPDSWGDEVVRPGMSGGPIWNERTGTVVAVVEGRKPRGFTPGDIPQGYGIQVRHLAACASELTPLRPMATPRARRTNRLNWRKVLPVAVAAILVLTFIVYQFLPGARPFSTATPGVSDNKVGTAQGTQLSHAAPLKLRVVAMKRRGDTVSVLKPGDVLTAEDHYSVFFEPAQQTFVYVLQQDATGTINVLFPDPQWTTQTNPVPAGQPVWVPKDPKYWFYLDENIGREVIIVVATRERNEKLESMLRGLDAGGALGALTAWFLAPERGRSGVRQFETGPLLSPDGKTLSLEIALVQGSGVDFVYTIAFQHK